MSEEVTIEEIENDYNCMLDMSMNLVEIGVYEFAPSTVLKKCDPIAYRQEINDFINSLLEDEDLFEFHNKYFTEPIAIIGVLEKLKIDSY